MMSLNDLSGVHVALTTPFDAMTGDIDLADFACRDARIGRYDALHSTTLQRLPTVHALSLIAAADTNRACR